MDTNERLSSTNDGKDTNDVEEPTKSPYELYVDGLMLGKSKRQAALAAGFTPHQASHPGRLIEGTHTHELMRKALTQRPSGGPNKSRRELYVAGIMDGKTKKQAALDAGFSKNQAHDAKRCIEGPITRALVSSATMEASLTLVVLVQKILDGLEATRPLVLPAGSGKAPTLEWIEDFETRLKYIQQACKLMGIDGVEDRNPRVVQVNIVDVADM